MRVLHSHYLVVVCLFKRAMLTVLTTIVGFSSKCTRRREAIMRRVYGLFVVMIVNHTLCDEGLRGHYGHIQSLLSTDT
jgi:hypothetical protein